MPGGRDPGACGGGGLSTNADLSHPLRPGSRRPPVGRCYDMKCPFRRSRPEEPTLPPTPPPSSKELQAEANRLWLGRTVAAPEAWRARAAGAGALLSAAAAAVLAGLLTGYNQDAWGGAAAAFTFGSAIAYVLAVAAFLTGAVWPSPKEGEVTDDFVKSVRKYVEDEAAPIRRLVKLGAAVGAIAVTLTGIAIGTVLYESPPSKGANIAVVDAKENTAMKALCPSLSNQFPARIRDVAGGRISVTVSAGVCGSQESTFILPAVDVVILERGAN